METILKWFIILVYAGLLIGSTLYFLFFAFSLLAEVKGWMALVVIAATFVGMCSILVNVKNLFK